jgi:hypothetical protein
MARIAAVSSSSASGMSTRPDHRTLSTAMTPRGESFGRTASK